MMAQHNTLNAGLKTLWIFSIAKKPYIFVIFKGGGVGPPVSPSGSAHVRIPTLCVYAVIVSYALNGMYGLALQITVHGV